jgi:hypothetical protein
MLASLEKSNLSQTLFPQEEAAKREQETLRTMLTLLKIRTQNLLQGHLED